VLGHTVAVWQPAATRAAPGISAHPSEDNLRYFNVMILGPQQSPYEGACPAASAAVPARGRHAVCWHPPHLRDVAVVCHVERGRQSPRANVPWGSSAPVLGDRRVCLGFAACPAAAHGAHFRRGGCACAGGAQLTQAALAACSDPTSAL